MYTLSRQFRLMLAGIPALTLAIHVGLSEYNCFSIEAFKSSMMATSIRCPGKREAGSEGDWLIERDCM